MTLFTPQQRMVLAKALGVEPNFNTDTFVDDLAAAMAAADPTHLTNVITAALTEPSPDTILFARDSRQSPDASYDPDLDDQMPLCAICNEGLHIFRSADGTTEYVHAQSWRERDHLPEAVLVPKGTPHTQKCDFCGRADTLAWEYDGKTIEVYSARDNTHRNHGHLWGACESCDSYVAVGDVTGLVDRIVRLSDGLRGADHRTIAATRAEWTRMHTEYVPSIHTRRRLGALPPPPRMHPRQMHKIRDGLLKLWASDTLYTRLAERPNHVIGAATSTDDGVFSVATGGDTPLTREIHDRHAHHISVGLRAAELYYISHDFTQLAINSGQDLPNLTITREELPAPHGFMIYETPIAEVPRPHGAAGIRAVSWTLAPGGVWFNVYFQTEDVDPAAGNTRANLGWLLTPNLGAGLLFGAAVHHGDTQPGIDVAATILATFFLLTQPGVTDVTTERPEPRLTRAYRRANRPATDIRIVDLRRRTPAERAAALVEAATRKVNVRFLVRGHWKRQAYGTGRSLRKTIYVQPFMKGPDGAPLKLPTATVKVLR